MDLFTVKSAWGEILSIVPASTSEFAAPSFSFTEAYDTTGDFGRMLFQKAGFRSADLWLSHYHIRSKQLFHGLVTKPTLEAHITLQDCYVQSQGKNQADVYDAGRFNLTAAPYMENRVLFPQGGDYVSFDIHPSQDLLERFAPDFPQLEDFLERLDHHPQEPVSLFQSPIFLSPRMNFLVLTILEQLKASNAKRCYIELHLQELLILLFLRGENLKESQWKLKARDVDALHHIRELIIHEAEQYDSEDLYDTIVQLADQAEMSLYKFKRGFKQLFGTAPYQLLLDTRLNRARQLLRDTRYPILDISMMTGYRSPEGFTKAYKKLFGIPPSAERK